MHLDGGTRMDMCDWQENLVEGLIMVVVLPEKKKGTTVRNESGSVRDCLDDTGEIEDGARYGRFMKFQRRAEGWIHSYG
jgi:hypothetical protein